MYVVWRCSCPSARTCRAAVGPADRINLNRDLLDVAAALLPIALLRSLEGYI